MVPECAQELSKSLQAEDWWKRFPSYLQALSRRVCQLFAMAKSSFTSVGIERKSSQSSMSIADKF